MRVDHNGPGGLTYAAGQAVPDPNGMIRNG